MAHPKRSSIVLPLLGYLLGFSVAAALFYRRCQQAPLDSVGIRLHAALGPPATANKLGGQQAVQVKLGNVLGSTLGPSSSLLASNSTVSAKGLPSDEWRPLLATICAPGMPKQYAPCLAAANNISNLHVAQEWVYPDFAIRQPHFVQPQHADIVLPRLEMRFRRERRGGAASPYWYYYLNQHGRNLVFSNVTYDAATSPPPGWTSDNRHCMGGKIVSHSQYARASRDSDVKSGTDLATFDTVMFAASPDSASFQHWSDRVAMMLVQTEEVRSSRGQIKYISSPPRDKSVEEGWRLLANVTDTSTQLMAPQGLKLLARSFIFACDTPLIHPYLMQRSGELLLAGAGLDPRGKPLSERRVVLMASRMNDKNALNGGRRWLNNKDCMAAIQQLLEKRGQGEVVQEWDYSQFQSHTDVIKFFSTEVRALVGTHGGAMYNAQFLTNPSLVLEIWPSRNGQTFVPTPNVIWEISSTRGLQHWALPVQTVDDRSSDVNVDCQVVVSILEQHLGRVYEATLEPFYQGVTWSA